jgi:hypothetical protein
MDKDGHINPIYPIYQDNVGKNAQVSPKQIDSGDPGHPLSEIWDIHFHILKNG